MKRQLKINKPIRGYKGGETISIEVDKNDIPKERYWRDRIKDSSVDNCVEYVSEKKTERKSAKKSETIAILS